MLHAAEMTAKRSLDQEEKEARLGIYGGSSRYRMHKYEQIFWDFARAAIICLGGRTSQEKELRLIAGVISFIVGLTTSYFVGRHWVALNEARVEEQRAFRQRTVCLPGYRQYSQSGKVIKQVLKIVSLEEEIFSKIKLHAEYGLAVKVALFVAALFGLAGAVVHSMPVLYLAAGLGISTSVAGLVGEGFRFSENERRRTAFKLLETLDHLKVSVDY